MEIMNKQQMINDIAALVANSEVSDAAAEKLLPIMYSLEAELEELLHQLRVLIGDKEADE